MKNHAIIILLITILSCKKDDKIETPTAPIITPTLSSNFGDTPLIFPLQAHKIDEASGICASKSMANNLWIQQDSGTPNELYLLSNQGNYLGKITVPVPNRDWEDIAIGSGPEINKNYIYLADIGDNNAEFNSCFIYRFIEPTSLTDTIKKVDKINFNYPDGARDAECILLDPATKDIYIVSKREANVQLYVLAYPQSTTELITAKFIAKLPINGGSLSNYVTSGGISEDGKEIVIKTYTQIYYWQRKNNESIIAALARTYDKILPYTIEPQGEGFCFDKGANGYFTISEIASASAINLYYYGRKN